jgi:phage baseplate assembly protein W
MKSSGNGDPAQCVANLLMTIRGEVPYERLKGADPSVFDAPSTEAAPRAQADMAWLLKTYEPRFDARSVGIPALAAKYGAFELRADGTVL